MSSKRVNLDALETELEKWRGVMTLPCEVMVSLVDELRLWRERAEKEPAVPAEQQGGWDLEEAAARVHDAWLATKRASGFTSRLSESGEELMRPYSELSEEAKELDRVTVRAVLAVLPPSPVDSEPTTEKEES